jgi:hypothetical protein
VDPAVDAAIVGEGVAGNRREKSIGGWLKGRRAGYFAVADLPAEISRRFASCSRNTRSPSVY